MGIEREARHSDAGAGVAGKLPEIASRVAVTGGVAPSVQPVGQAVDRHPARTAVPAHLPRPRLVARLDAARDRRLVALIAPAGFGKTALLTEWAQADRRPIAWINISERYDDPAALLGLLTHAVDRLSEMTTGLVTDLDADGVSAWAGSTRTLGTAIRRCTQSIVVILDDAEKLANPRAIDVIVAFAEHLPRRSQVVIGARSSAGWPIAKLVAAGEAAVLGTPDLAFDAVEVAALLGPSASRGTPSAADRILARTDGWPVGVYLEALAQSREGRSAGRAAAAASGALRLMSDYVKTEVLASLSQPDAEFLVRTSHLERLTASLCDAVLERTDSAEVLRRIERTCLFVTRLGGGEWYRVQRLLRDVLREELQGDPQTVVVQSQRAAAWFEANDLGDEALACSFAARDLPRISRVLPAAIYRAFASGRVDTARAWLYDVERSADIAAHPHLAATAAIAYALMDDAGRAERCSDVATRGAFAAMGDPVLVGRAAVARALLCRDGAQRMLVDARTGVEALPATSDEAAMARLLLGVARTLTGDPAHADRTLAAAVEAGFASEDAGWVACAALVFRARLADLRGDRDRADAFARRARATMRDFNLESQFVAALVHAMQARLAAHHGAGVQARSDLASAERLRGSLTHALPWAALRARLDIAASLLALSDVAGARLQQREIQEILWLRPQMGELDAESRQLTAQVEAIRETNLSAFMLTVAELRLLPLLATHLTFPEIGERLFLSTNTIKTEAKSIYRKLNVASRSAAVERAAEIGLLEPWIRLQPVMAPDTADTDLVREPV